ncbi:MAG TPA: GAF domain-containing protein [Archangium sp.]|jgi:GAF domain-containing protein|uniref:GAF domain-containing protein n=1 Tax=Archangium sp. TaxID=1872627 RepID=UPI002ED8309C
MPTMPEGTEHLTASLHELRRDNERLQGQVHQLRSEHQKLAVQVAHLARLYSASCRLHEPEERPLLAEIIGEIIKDLIGAEEFAIFELEPGAPVLSLLGCLGVDPEPLRRVSVAEGLIGRVARTGTRWVAETAPTREAEPSACLPLKSDGRVHGVVAIFRLLPHKPGFTPADRALFELLETQAGRALHVVRATG